MAINAYFALNEKRTYYIGLFAAVTVLNGVIGVGHAARGEIFVNGQTSFSGSLNLLCAILFLVVLGALLIKEIVSRREEE